MDLSVQITDGADGLLYDPGNVGSLAAVLTRVMYYRLDRDPLLGAAAQRTARGIGPDQVVQAVHDIIDSLAEASGSRMVSAVAAVTNSSSEKHRADEDAPDDGRKDLLGRDGVERITAVHSVASVGPTLEEVAQSSLTAQGTAAQETRAGWRWLQCSLPSLGLALEELWAADTAAVEDKEMLWEYRERKRKLEATGQLRDEVLMEEMDEFLEVVTPEERSDRERLWQEQLEADEVGWPHACCL